MVKRASTIMQSKATTDALTPSRLEFCESSYPTLTGGMHSGVLAPSDMGGFSQTEKISKSHWSLHGLKASTISTWFERAIGMA